MQDIRKILPEKKTILICDDQRDFVNSCTLALRADFNVIKAYSGKEFMKLISESNTKGMTPDVVLMDYHLGDMQAEEVLAKIKSLELWKAKTKILIISGAEDVPFSNNAEQSPFVSGLRKPFTLEKLRKEIAAKMSLNTD